MRSWKVSKDQVVRFESYEFGPTEDQLLGVLIYDREVKGLLWWDESNIYNDRMLLGLGPRALTIGPERHNVREWMPWWFWFGP